MSNLLDHRRPKRLNEMDDLRDMGRFPTSVYMGATGNILFTIAATYRFGKGKSNLWLLPWAVGTVAANVAPVIVLRRNTPADAPMPLIEQMDFFGDQHKFATWVYAIASGNMFFWITLAWTVFRHERSLRALAAVWLLAFVCTFFPAWIRLVKHTHLTA